MHGTLDLDVQVGQNRGCLRAGGDRRGNASEGEWISDLYVSWAAYGAGQGKDVYYYDIQTGVTTYLEETGPGNQINTTTAGDFLLFDTEDATGYFHIDQYRYSTGEITRLIDDGYDRRAPSSRGNLAVWADYRYDQSWHRTGGMADLVVYDLVTGELRRITKSSGSYLPGYVQDGWLVYGIGHGGFYSDLRAINLVRLGLVDELGHVIPE